MAVNEIDRDYLRLLHQVDLIENIMGGLKSTEASDEEKRLNVGNLTMLLESELLDSKWAEAGKDMTRVQNAIAPARTYWKATD